MLLCGKNNGRDMFCLAPAGHPGACDDLIHGSIYTFKEASLKAAEGAPVDLGVAQPKVAEPLALPGPDGKVSLTGASMPVAASDRSDSPDVLADPNAPPRNAYEKARGRRG